MQRYGPGGGSNRGFTLLEVLLAAAILATAATTLVAIHIHSVRQATHSRELSYATSAARNALAEALANPDQQSAVGDLPQRANLRITFEMQPAGDQLLTDTLAARVEDKAGGETVCQMQTRRAVYIQPEEPADEAGGQPGEEAGGDAQEQ